MYPQLVERSDLFIIEDEGVVFCEETQQLFMLNTMATFIWMCCQDKLSRPQIARSVSDRFGLDREQAAGYVEQALASWQEFSPFSSQAGSSDLPESDSLADRVSPTETARALLPGEVAVERRYSVLEQSFLVRCMRREQDRVLHQMLAHLEGATGRGDGIVLEVMADGAGHLLVRDGQVIARCGALEELAPLVHAAIFTTVFDRSVQFLAFHAAAVSDGQYCILLPGAAGSGKTTVTAALLHAGWEFLCDDIAFLDRQTLHASGLPFGLCIKESGFDAALQHYPHLAELPIHRRRDGKRVRYVAPPEGSFDRTLRLGCPVKCIVFPKYVPNRPGGVQRVRAPETWRRLMSHRAQPNPLQRSDVSRLIDWIRGMGCYELTFSSTPAAVAALKSLVAT